MTFLRHEAFYMRAGATQVVRERRDRLEKLATQPLRRKTRFLIVSHPAPGERNPEAEAMNGAKAIALLLSQYNNDITGLVHVWSMEEVVAMLEAKEREAPQPARKRGPRLCKPHGLPPIKPRTV